MAVSSETDLLDPTSTELEGPQLPAYREISGRAVIGVLVGLASFLAFVHPVLCGVPLIGIVVNCLALRQLAMVGPAMIGRTAAWFGLACSVLSGALSPIPPLVHRAGLRAEAQAFARQWFTELRQGRVDTAYQLTRPAHMRWPLDEALAVRYEREPKQKRELDRYALEAPVEIVLAHGARAEVRYLGNERMELGVDRHEFVEVYSLTFDDAGRQTSQVLKLKLIDIRNTMTRAWAWHLGGAELGTTALEGPGSLVLAAGDGSQPAAVAVASDARRARPVLVVPDVDFDFGQARLHTEGMRHAFRVHNAGDAPLEILEASVSCTKCTFVDFSRDPIPPRGTAEVTVRWNVESSGTGFMQNVTLRTNDPETPDVHLTIHGDIVPVVQVEPAGLALSNLSPGEPTEAHVRIYANYSADVQLLEHRFVHRQTADFFSLRAVRLEPAELTPRAQGGLDLAVTIKPGLPLGPLEQELVVTTNIEGAEELRIPIQAMVTGDITVIGRDWQTDAGKSWLEIGVVRQNRGAKRTLKLLVRGPQRRELAFGSPQCDPECVQANLHVEQKAELNGGAVIQVPLTVEIPPGSPLVSRMGGTEGLGAITIPTNQRATGDLKIYVRFAVVEGEGR